MHLRKQEVISLYGHTMDRPPSLILFCQRRRDCHEDNKQALPQPIEIQPHALTPPSTARAYVHKPLALPPPMMQSFELGAGNNKKKEEGQRRRRRENLSWEYKREEGWSKQQQQASNLQLKAKTSLHSYGLHPSSSSF